MLNLRISFGSISILRILSWSTVNMSYLYIVRSSLIPFNYVVYFSVYTSGKYFIKHIPNIKKLLLYLKVFLNFIFRVFIVSNRNTAVFYVGFFHAAMLNLFIITNSSFFFLMWIPYSFLHMRSYYQQMGIVYLFLSGPSIFFFLPNFPG